MKLRYEVVKVSLIRPAFYRNKLDVERTKSDEEPFTIRLTAKDKVWFEPAKIKIKQPKKGTAMKQLAEIGAMIVLHDQKMAKIIEVIGGNLYKNNRIGLPESVYIEAETDANVTQKEDV